MLQLLFPIHCPLVFLALCVIVRLPVVVHIVVAVFAKHINAIMVSILSSITKAYVINKLLNVKLQAIVVK